jgi:hypothetical protein
MDNSWARLELGDNSVYASCTHREVQTPVTWSYSSVTFTGNTAPPAQAEVQTFSKSVIPVMEDMVANTEMTSFGVAIMELPVMDSEGSASIVLDPTMELPTADPDLAKLVPLGPIMEWPVEDPEFVFDVAEMGANPTVAATETLLLLDGGGFDFWAQVEMTWPGPSQSNFGWTDDVGGFGQFETEPLLDQFRALPDWIQ